METHVPISMMERPLLGVFPTKGVKNESEERKAQQENANATHDFYSEEYENKSKRRSAEGWSAPYNEWY